nr:NinB/ Orf homologous recombination mediator [Caudoviricetes sp.]CAI9751744.1 NinB/ Orf homologous recombination mediator [Caudoviricetes sp.]
MDVTLVKTDFGLQAYGNVDYDQLSKIPKGRIVQAKIVMPRNPKFHRKFFSLIRAAWDCLTEEQRKNLRSVESFREQLLITSGFSTPVFDVNGNVFQEKAKSIAFGSMDEAEFGDVYSRVLDTILTIISMNGMSEKQFDVILSNYG